MKKYSHEKNHLQYYFTKKKLLYKNVFLIMLNCSNLNIY